MVEAMSFEAQPRERSGKGAARALRRAGRVPAVVYGEGEAQQFVSVEARLLKRALNNPRFHSTLMTLDVSGTPVRVLPREIQLHPVTDDPIHADFQRVAQGATVTVTVPVTFVNEEASPGLRRGGMVNVVRREVELVCPADAIPERITLDLAGFDINDSLHISDAALPAGVRPAITDRDFTIATISAPTSVAAQAAAEQEAAESARAGAEEREAGG